MWTMTRVLVTTGVLCLLATACDTPSPTTTANVKPFQHPTYDGIGMVGSGGRSAPGDSTGSGTTGTTATAGGDTLSVRT